MASVHWICSSHPAPKPFDVDLKARLPRWLSAKNPPTSAGEAGDMRHGFDPWVRMIP